MTDEIELSDEMLEAVRILRSDHRAVAFKEMTASNQALVQRLDKKDADDAEWRKTWEERYSQGSNSGSTQPSGGSPQGNNPTVDNPETNPGGAPPAPEVIVPVEEKKKRRHGWFGEMDDD